MLLSLCVGCIPPDLLGLESFIDIDCKILLCFVKYSCFRSFFLPSVKSYYC